MTSNSNLNTASEKTATTNYADPVLYLDTVRATQFAQSYKRKTFELVGAREGAHIIDVGCGTGDDVLAMARLVGEKGRVVGIELNPTLIAEGWKRVAGKNLPVEFMLCDAHKLSFEDNTFDGYRSDRAVQHMDDPVKVLAEAMRVVRSGGKIVISEPDWDTLAIDSDNRDVTRRIIRFISDRVVRHGWLGRQLPGLFKRAGLKDVNVLADTFILTDLKAAERIWLLRRQVESAQKAGAITASEMDEWLGQLEEADRAGRFFSATVGFVTCGTNP
jgi:ubiquinone/menaquinone biosynthesis C-methylase UbiE